MARHTIKVRTWTSVGSLALVLLLSFGTLCAVALRADASNGLSIADLGAIKFTIIQSLLSATFSCLLAIPVARAIARRSFQGRSLLITLLGAPFIIPVIVAILGLIAVFGRAGLIAEILGVFGLSSPAIYGLHGVVLAHVFFNLPLATRLLLQGWLAIPSERFRLSASLGFSSNQIQRHLEFPMLREVLPGAFVVIFLICLTSFAVALTLGGGPRATTVELAIYQAFIFEFDLGAASRLALCQFILAGVAGLLAWKIILPAAFGSGLDRTTERWDAQAFSLKTQDIVVIIFAATFLLLPMGLVTLKGIGGIINLSESVVWAALRSLIVSISSVVIMLILALPIVLTASRTSQSRSSLMEGIGLLMIAASPMVMGTGLFIVLFPIADPGSIALPVTAVVNAAASLPFALRSLIPTARRIEAEFGKLADSLDLKGIVRIRYLFLPRIRPQLGFAMGITAALSMGDLGVIALFSSTGSPTLPLYIYQLMGAYRMEQAAGAAVLLLIISLLLYWIFDRGGRSNVET